MRSVRQPTRFTLEKATDLGRMMAMAEPRLLPNLGGAHEYSGYVQFLQAHRHRLEQEPHFEPWDARLNTLIEAEGKMLGYVLTHGDDWDELVAVVATPIRCAFWYGWETVHNVKSRYDQQVQQVRAQDSQMQVLHVQSTPNTPTVATTILTDGGDDLWDSIAASMLASFEAPITPPPPPPNPGIHRR